jgi:hypothetical protein
VDCWRGKRENTRLLKSDVEKRVQVISADIDGVGAIPRKSSSTRLRRPDGSRPTWDAKPSSLSGFYEPCAEGGVLAGPHRGVAERSSRGGDRLTQASANQIAVTIPLLIAIT